MPQFDYYIFFSIIISFLSYICSMYFYFEIIFIPSIFSGIFFRKLKLIWNYYILKILDLLEKFYLTLVNFYLFNFFRFYILLLINYDF